MTMIVGVGVIVGVALEFVFGVAVGVVVADVVGVGGGVGTTMDAGTAGALAGRVRKGLKVKVPRSGSTLESEIVRLMLVSSVVPHQLFVASTFAASSVK